MNKEEFKRIQRLSMDYINSLPDEVKDGVLMRLSNLYFQKVKKGDKCLKTYSKEMGLDNFYTEEILAAFMMAWISVFSRDYESNGSHMLPHKDI